MKRNTEIIGILIIIFFMLGTKVSYAETKGISGVFLVNPLIYRKIINIEDDIRNLFPHANIKKIKGTYCVGIFDENIKAVVFEKKINLLYLKYAKKISASNAYSDEEKKANSNMLKISRNRLEMKKGVFEAKINITVNDEDKIKRDSFYYLLSLENNINEFLRKKHNLLSIPAFDSKKEFRSFLSNMRNKIQVRRINNVDCVIYLNFNKKQNIEQAIQFYLEKADKLRYDFDAKGILNFYELVPENYNKIFQEIPPWLDGKNIKESDAHAILRDTIVSLSYDRVYLGDFLSDLSRKYGFSYSVEFPQGISGNGTDMKVDDMMSLSPVEGEELKIVGLYALSIKAENVRLGSLLDNVLKRFNLKYSIGDYNGKKMIFIENKINK